MRPTCWRKDFFQFSFLFGSLRWQLVWAVMKTQREGVSETASYRAVYYFTKQLLPADVNPPDHRASFRNIHLSRLAGIQPVRASQQGATVMSQIWDSRNSEEMTSDTTATQPVRKNMMWCTRKRRTASTLVIIWLGNFFIKHFMPSNCLKITASCILIADAAWFWILQGGNCSIWQKAAYDEIYISLIQLQKLV